MARRKSKLNSEECKQSIINFFQKQKRFKQIQTRFCEIKTDFYNSNGKLKKEKACEMYDVYAERFGQDLEEFYNELIKDR